MMTLETRLQVGDSYAERCRTYEEIAQRAQQQLEAVLDVSDGTADVSYLRFQARMLEFDALYHRFIAFSPYSVSNLNEARDLRPNWPYFGQQDFTNLCRTILFLAYGCLYELKPRSYRKNVNDLFYPGSEDGKESACWVRAAFGVVSELPLAATLSFANEVYFSRTSTKGLLIWLRYPHDGQDTFVSGLNKMNGAPYFGVLTNVQLPQLLRLCTTIRARWEDILSGNDALDLATLLNQKLEAQKQACHIIERCYLS